MGHHSSLISIWMLRGWPLPSGCDCPTNSSSSKQSTHQIPTSTIQRYFGDHIKGHAEIQMTSRALSSSTDVVTQLYKATDLVMQDLPLVNWCWLPQIIWSSAFTTYSSSWENIVLQGSSMSILILELHCLDFFLLRANAVTLLHNHLNSHQTQSWLL